MGMAQLGRLFYIPGSVSRVGNTGGLVRTERVRVTAERQER